jgi:hypothetical protein
MKPPLLAAALIVKDESANLPGCLQALASLGDLIGEVVIYDTGSTDGTVDLARAAGARVELGYWDGDFARAKNAAVALTRARWVLIVDADERVDADVVRLRAVLEGRDPGVRSISRLDAVVVPLVNIAADGSEMYSVPLVRIFKPARAAHRGRLHERVERRDGAVLRYLEVARDVVQLRHLGYSDPVVTRRKAERNLALADAELSRLHSQPHPDQARLARALYHRGRTLIIAGRPGGAVEELRAMRRVPVRVDETTWGTDVLAQLLIDLGQVGEIPSLVEDLREAGVDRRYCAWLSAQAHVARGEFTAALVLLRTVDALVDSVGRIYDLAPVVEAHLMAAGRVGEVDEAAAACIRLMAGHGRVEGYGSLLLTLWGDRPVAWLVELLTGADAGHLPAVVAELERCSAPGPELAAALSATHPATSRTAPIS